MTTAAKEAKRVYDIERRPEYAARKVVLRRERWKEKEKEARAKRLIDPTIWAKYVIHRIKHRAKKKNLEFNLKPEDIVLPKQCPVLDIPIVVSLGYGARTADECPSIDRVNNKLGYIQSNIRVISNRANKIKRDATIEELEAIIKYMRESLS